MKIIPKSILNSIRIKIGLNSIVYSIRTTKIRQKSIVYSIRMKNRPISIVCSIHKEIRHKSVVYSIRMKIR